MNSRNATVLIGRRFSSCASGALMARLPYSAAAAASDGLAFAQQQRRHISYSTTPPLSMPASAHIHRNDYDYYDPLPEEAGAAMEPPSQQQDNYYYAGKYSRVAISPQHVQQRRSISSTVEPPLNLFPVPTSPHHPEQPRHQQVQRRGISYSTAPLSMPASAHMYRNAVDDYDLLEEEAAGTAMEPPSQQQQDSYYYAGKYSRVAISPQQHVQQRRSISSTVAQPPLNLFPVPTSPHHHPAEQPRHQQVQRRGISSATATLSMPASAHMYRNAVDDYDLLEEEAAGTAAAMEPPSQQQQDSYYYAGKYSRVAISPQQHVQQRRSISSTVAPPPLQPLNSSTSS